MRYLVTGSAGHLGEALMRTGRARGYDMRGADRLASDFTDIVGDLADPAVAFAAASDRDVTLHTATLHKPHVATHDKSAFIASNITATLNLLEAAKGQSAFVFTSTTSTFGAALRPPLGAPAAWITEDVRCVPKNIYGATKTGAEDICHLFARTEGLPVIILRTSRFFPEPDDDPVKRAAFPDANAKVNELAFRRVDIADAVEAHFLATTHAPTLGFGRYIISAPTPFLPDDLAALRTDAPAVLNRRLPDAAAIYAANGWQFFPSIDRVYDSSAAQRDLGWAPRYTLLSAAQACAGGAAFGSQLTQDIGIKGYHGDAFADGIYPV